MAIDKADWHWDDTEKLYRKTNNVEGKLTEEQQEEIWLLASNHIGLFLRWLIDRGFNELIDESDEESCVQVREGKMSGAEYLMYILNGAFCEKDLKHNVHDSRGHGKYAIDHHKALERRLWPDKGRNAEQHEQDADDERQPAKAGMVTHDALPPSAPREGSA